MQLTHQTATSNIHMCTHGQALNTCTHIHKKFRSCYCLFKTLGLSTTLRLNSTCFLYIKPWSHRCTGFLASPVGSHNVFSEWSRQEIQPRCLSLWLPFFGSQISFTGPRKLPQLLRVHNVPSTSINPLSKNLALNLLIFKANSIMSDAVD